MSINGITTLTPSITTVIEGDSTQLTTENFSNALTEQLASLQDIALPTETGAQPQATPVNVAINTPSPTLTEELAMMLDKSTSPLRKPDATPNVKTDTVAETLSTLKQALNLNTIELPASQPDLLPKESTEPPLDFMSDSVQTYRTETNLTQLKQRDLSTPLRFTSNIEATSPPITPDLHKETLRQSIWAGQSLKLPVLENANLTEQTPPSVTVGVVPAQSLTSIPDTDVLNDEVAIQTTSTDSLPIQPAPELVATITNPGVIQPLPTEKSAPVDTVELSHNSEIAPKTNQTSIAEHSQIELTPPAKTVTSEISTTMTVSTATAITHETTSNPLKKEKTIPSNQETTRTSTTTEPPIKVSNSLFADTQSIKDASNTTNSTTSVSNSKPAITQASATTAQQVIEKTTLSNQETTRISTTTKPSIEVSNSLFADTQPVKGASSATNFTTSISNSKPDITQASAAADNTEIPAVAAKAKQEPQIYQATVTQPITVTNNNTANSAAITTPLPLENTTSTAALFNSEQTALSIPTATTQQNISNTVKEQLALTPITVEASQVTTNVTPSVNNSMPPVLTATTTEAVSLASMTIDQSLAKDISAKLETISENTTSNSAPHNARSLLSADGLTFTKPTPEKLSTITSDISVAGPSNNKSSVDVSPTLISSNLPLETSPQTIETTSNTTEIGSPSATPSAINHAPANPIAVKTEQLSLNKPLQHPEWSQDFGEQIIWLHDKNIPSAEIRLNPAHLGPISIRIDQNQDQTSIMFTAQHAEVRDALEASLPKLREMLGSQQLNLSNVNISQYSNHTPSNHQGSNTQFNDSPKGNNQYQAADVPQDTAEKVAANQSSNSQGLNLYA